MKKYEKANYYLRKALTESKYYGENRVSVAVYHNNIGLLYKAKEEFDTAIFHFEECLSIVYENDLLPLTHQYLTTFKNNLSLAYSEAGYLHFDKGDYKKGYTFFQKGRTLSNELRDTFLVVSNLLYIGASLKYLTHYDSALIYLDQGIAYIETCTHKKAYKSLINMSENNSGNVSRIKQAKEMKIMLEKFYLYKASCIKYLGQEKRANEIIERLKKSAMKRGDKDFLKEIEIEEHN